MTLQACNANGCSSIARPVTVVDPAPSIVSVGTVPSLVGTAELITLSAETLGRPSLTHRWTVSGTGLTTGSLVLTGNPVQWSPASSGPGTYQIRLEVMNTAGTVQSSAQAVTVQTSTFRDVSPNYWAFSYIETLASRGVTSGCSVNPPLYCPGDQVTRAQMAVFLIRSQRGPVFLPPLATGLFADVTPNYWAADYIEQLYVDGITSGCVLVPLSYCPETVLTRAQMAVFLLRAKHGILYLPPPATGTVFADVPVNAFAAAWIEQLAAEGITGGCATGPARYCPDSPVSRDQMATFLVRTFELTPPN